MIEPKIVWIDFPNEITAEMSGAKPILHETDPEHCEATRYIKYSEYKDLEQKLSIAREALDRIGVRTEVSVDIKTEDCMKTDLDRIKELASQALEKLK